MNKMVVIKTKSGKIQGYKEKGLDIFKGIPYGEPPIGDLRFTPPMDIVLFKDILSSKNLLANLNPKVRIV